MLSNTHIGQLRSIPASGIYQRVGQIGISQAGINQRCSLKASPIESNVVKIAAAEVGSG